MIERFPEESQFAIRAVTQAARISREVQTSWTRSALMKSDQSPVTVADFAAQAIVARALEKAFPDHSRRRRRQPGSSRSGQRGYAGSCAPLRVQN